MSLLHSEEFPALGSQSPALRALLAVSEQHPTLPGAYTVVSQITPDEVTVQLDSLHDLETWRTALLADPDTVTLHNRSTHSTLRFTTQVHGVTFEVWTAFEAANPTADLTPGAGS